VLISDITILFPNPNEVPDFLSVEGYSMGGELVEAKYIFGKR